MKTFSRPRALSLAAIVLGVGAAHCSGGIVVNQESDDGGTLPDGAPVHPDGSVLPDGGPRPPNVGEPKEHRPNADSCALPRPPGVNLDAGALDAEAGTFQRCNIDAECTSGANGRCTGSRLGLTCTYDACNADSECTQGTNGVCACRNLGGLGTNNQCTQGGNCKVDSQCTGGSRYCSPSWQVGCNLSFQGFFCHTPGDECVSDDECKSDGGPGFGDLCTYDPMASKWACSRVMCAG